MKLYPSTHENVNRPTGKGNRERFNCGELSRRAVIAQKCRRTAKFRERGERDFDSVDPTNPLNNFRFTAKS